VQPPSHVETIDPTEVDSDVEFGSPRVEKMADGSIRVIGVSRLFSFEPDPIEVPYGVPVTFRLTSPDVIHGFQIVGTNANATIVPGYVSQFAVTFPQPGEYLIVCNEYCGLAHHMMQGRVVVTEEVK
jgi:cytochrome c oxidase subunit 2